MRAILTEPHYMPCVQQVAAIAHADLLLLHCGGRYRKQTYRNRCHILSANGVQALTVPVAKGNNWLPLHQVKISPHEHWQRQHCKAIRSAYGGSPYFLYYADAICNGIMQPVQSLALFTVSLYHTLLPLLGISKPIRIYNEMEFPLPDLVVTNLQDVHLPHSPVAGNLLTYPQVFGYKHGFVPGLSVLDLLFNQGPAAAKLLSA